jgi:hypothetical protein
MQKYEKGVSQQSRNSGRFAVHIALFQSILFHGHRHGLTRVCSVSQYSPENAGYQKKKKAQKKPRNFVQCPNSPAPVSLAALRCACSSSLARPLLSAVHLQRLPHRTVRPERMGSRNTAPRMNRLRSRGLVRRRSDVSDRRQSRRSSRSKVRAGCHLVQLQRQVQHQEHQYRRIP